MPFFHSEAIIATLFVNSDHYGITSTLSHNTYEYTTAQQNYCASCQTNVFGIMRRASCQIRVMTRGESPDNSVEETVFCAMLVQEKNSILSQQMGSMRF